jgi:hypothetical protein
MKPKIKRECKLMARQKGALSYKQPAVLKPHYKVIFLFYVYGISELVLYDDPSNIYLILGTSNRLL